MGAMDRQPPCVCVCVPVYAQVHTCPSVRGRVRVREKPGQVTSDLQHSMEEENKALSFSESRWK